MSSASISGFAAVAQQVGLQLPAGVEFPRPIIDVSVLFDEHIKSGALGGYKPIPTGFASLDRYLGGGLIPGSLAVVGGAPGVGKTVLILQIARHIAATQREAAALVVCFEHDEVYLYHRLICLESYIGADGAEPRGVTMNDIRRAVMNTPSSQAGLEMLLNSIDPARAAFERMVGYWERLFLAKAHPAKTTPRVLDIYLTTMRRRYPQLVLLVDYLQKVPVFLPGVEVTPERQIRYVVEELKNMTLQHNVPIVAIAAAEAEGLKEGTVHFEDLWGGSSIKYEPDVAIMLNPSPQPTRTGPRHVVFSIEKNRMGPTGVNLTFALHGEFFAFDTQEIPA